MAGIGLFLGHPGLLHERLLQGRVSDLGLMRRHQRRME